MARWTNAAVGARATIEAHLDRRAALDGCDYVVNMIQVGGHAAHPDRLRGAEALRPAPDDRRHARHRRHLPRAAHDPGDARRSRADMAELCPDAWLLNYTNPMAMLCWATYAGSADPDGSSACATRCSGRPREPRRARRRARTRRSTTSAPGVNHQAWILRFQRDGADLYPLLDDGDRARSRAAPARARRALPPVRLLPDRVERALGRVRAVVHARRRDDRAVPGAGRRVRAPQRGEPARCTRSSGARSPRAARSRSSAASSTPR